MVQIAPATAIQFAIYHHIVDRRPSWSLIAGFVAPHDDAMHDHVGCRALAGVCAKVATLPLDTIKKRMQISGFGEARRGFGLYRGQAAACA